MRRRSMPTAAHVTAAGVAPASRVGLSKRRTGQQDGSEDTDGKTCTFTHDCYLHGLGGVPPRRTIDDDTSRITTRVASLGAPRGVKVC
jgi:hypothetical protein